MNALRTTDSTVDELLAGIEDLPPRAQTAVLRLAEGTEAIGRKKDFSNPTLQEWLESRLTQKKKAIEFERAANGLFNELANLGIRIDRLSDLSKEGDKRAIVPLLSALASSADRTLTLQILAVLSTPWAEPEVVEPLMDYFGELNEDVDSEPRSIRSHVMAALEAHAKIIGPDYFVAIASEPRNGESRLSAVRALGKFPRRKSKLVPTVLHFLNSDDPDLYFCAAQVLAHWKIPEARPRIQELVDTSGQGAQIDPQSALDPDFVRAEMRKLLWKIPPIG